LPPYARKSFFDLKTFDPFEKEENKLFPITLFSWNFIDEKDAKLLNHLHLQRP
jgi:hypothetical protein